MRQIVLVLFVIAVATRVMTAADFYVAAGGDDSRSGQSPEQAWKTIQRVNSYGKDPGFRPGDRVLFQGGQTFSDAVLTVCNSGKPGQPIVFGSYGRGRAHLTHGGVEHEEIVAVENQRYVIIEHLEITNPDFDMEKIARGIRVEFTEPGEYPGLVIRGCYVHDIHGGMWNNRHLRGGIWMRARQRVNASSVNMLIENNRVERCHTRGIKVGGQSDSWHRGLVVRNNHVQDTGMAGIVIDHVTDGRIEGNTVYRAGHYFPEGDQAGVLAACWAAHSRNIIIQCNEVAYTKLGDANRPDGNLNEMSHDSQAFDIDVGAPGWHLIQYNYTHDNEGGFFLWMGKPGPEFEWAVIRYNLSVNDGKGFDNRLFELHSHKEDATYPVFVYNNTFVNDERIWVNNRARKQDRHKGWVFENNIFHAPVVAFDDQTSIAYRRNLYFPAAPLKVDADAIGVDPKLARPGPAGDGWKAIDAFAITGDSPACRKAIVETSRKRCSVGQRDLWGHVLPREKRAIGACEPVGAKRFATGGSFKARAELLIEQVAAHGKAEGKSWVDSKYAAYPAMAQFAVGNVKLGREIAEKQLNGCGAMFREFTTMACFMKYRHLYGKELEAKVKDNQLRHSALYAPDKRARMPGASENHKLMYAAANYLGGLAWPEDYPREWFEAGRDHLNYWFDQIARHGFWEEDSPTYVVHHMGPILSVWEHAPEGSEMKRKAKMTLDWYVAAAAPEYLRGYWIATAARDKTPVHGVEWSQETSTLWWLLFSDINEPAPHPNPTSGHPPFIHWFCALHFATSDYRPPPILRHIARDRDQPFVHREYMRRNPTHPRDYVYMNRTYGLASTVAEDKFVATNMTRWRLQWLSTMLADEPTVFLMKHPEPGKADWQQWRGASPHEHVLQHEGAMIAVYDIPADDPHPFIDGPLNRKAYRRILKRDGWWFFETDAVLFGVWAANGLKEAAPRIGYAHYGEGPKIGVLRSDGRRNGLVLQTALPQEFSADANDPPLDAFADAVLARTKITYTPGTGDTGASLDFHALDGTVLRIDADGQKKLNDKPLAVDTWPLLGNPWMQQKLDGRILRMQHGGRSVTYDFNSWNIENPSR